MTARLLTVLTATLALAACASQPKPLRGDYVETLTPHNAILGDYTGAAVRWGGLILQLEPGPDVTCFEMMATQLTAGGRPYWTSNDTRGRFIACRPGFYDPAVFTVNREVTFTGRIAGYDTRRIGEYDYRFPRIDADVVYLWPVRERAEVITRPAPWPWWGYW